MVDADFLTIDGQYRESLDIELLNPIEPVSELLEPHFRADRDVVQQSRYVPIKAVERLQRRLFSEKGQAHAQVSCLQESQPRQPDQGRKEAPLVKEIPRVIFLRWDKFL